MATKKTTTKKAPAKKKAVAKASKATTKKTTKSARAAKTQHLKLQREQEDFMTFRVNRETIYWLVLGAVAIFFTLWILQLQSNIQKLYDEIDATTASTDVTMNSVRENQ